MKYRVEIDGLRAFAVLVVVFFHAGVPFFNGGFIGVDIFFVISGYLITGIILNQLNENNFSISTFYSRRIKRILPALILVCLTSSVLSIFLLNPSQLNEFGNNLIGVATFLSNIVQIFTKDYFDQASELNPLIHMWTLSVEEQYYIGIPLLLTALYKLNLKRITMPMIASLACLSLMASIALTDLSQNSFLNKISFYIIFSRAWELLAGSFVAILILNYPNLTLKRSKNDLLILIGLLMICAPVILYNSSTPFPGINSIPVIVGTSILILFLSKDSMFYSLFSSKLVVGIGLISYSLYLWHQPLLAFTKLYFTNSPNLDYISILVVLISILVSYLSWKFIENPARRSQLNDKIIIIYGLISLVSIFILGLLLKDISSGYEKEMAKQLTENKFIYYQNVDEKLFAYERLKSHKKNVDTVIIGSSRLMQLDLASSERSSLNLSVSGAFLHDILPLSIASIKTLKPSELIIGIDPWIINKNADQPSSFFINDQVLDEMNFWNNLALEELKTGVTAEEISRSNTKLTSSILYNIYKIININQATFVASDGFHEVRAKKSYSGLHIYGLVEENKRYLKEKQYSYAAVNDDYMGNYEFSELHLNKLSELFEFAKNNGVQLQFFLTPYLPEAYEELQSRKSPIIQVENIISEFANDLGVKVYGSYNPNQYNCSSEEFYGALHPVKGCIDKIIEYSPIED